MTKPRRKTKLTARAKAMKDDEGSQDEPASSSSDGSDVEEKVGFYTRDPKSPFTDVDLIVEYSKPEFQALLTDEDKKELADLLPDHINLTADGQLPDDFVRYNADFRSAVRQYQTDLEGGRLDPTWLAEADAAMEERAQGNFDLWKEEQFEQFWGQKQKVDPRALAGQSSTVKLNRLIEAGLCQVGDMWSYSRVFGQGKKKIVVEKEFKLTDIDGEILNFAVPPGSVKYARRLKIGGDTAEKANGDLSKIDVPASPGSESAISSIPSDVEDYLPVSVTSLAALEEQIVALDGQFSGKVNGNAWKSIRVNRQQQDLGSLFDIRENYFVYGKGG